MKLILAAIVFTLCCCPLSYADTYACILVGNSADADVGKQFAQEADGWTKVFSDLKFDSAHLQQLRTPEGADESAVTGTRTMRDRIMEQLNAWKEKLTPNDDAILVLIGYGAAHGNHYQFQIKGPRLTDEDLVRGLAGSAHSYTVFVTGPGGSLLTNALTGHHDIVISATDSAEEVYQPRWDSKFLEAAQADPHEPLVQLLADTEEKIAAFYHDESYIRQEHAELRIAGGKPVEAPFYVPLPNVLVKRWTLDHPGVPILKEKRAGPENVPASTPATQEATAH